MNIKSKGLTLEIENDNFPINPRTEYDNLGKIFAWHRRYNLGDKHDYPASQDFHNDKKLQDDIFVSLPVYMYDHSGITISTMPFSCKWDSGQLGVIVALKTDVLKEFGDLSEQTKSKVTELLQNEIIEYDNYLTGNFYRYSIIGQEGELIDSMGGFNGHSVDEVLKQMKLTASSTHTFLFDKMLNNANASSYQM